MTARENFTRSLENLPERMDSFYSIRGVGSAFADLLKFLRPHALSNARKYSFLTAEGRAHVARLVREGKTPRQAIDETLMLALTPDDHPARQDRCA